MICFSVVYILIEVHMQNQILFNIFLLTNMILIFFLFDFWCFNATFSSISAISWRPVLVVEEARENRRPWASNYKYELWVCSVIFNKNLVILHLKWRVYVNPLVCPSVHLSFLPSVALLFQHHDQENTYILPLEIQFYLEGRVGIPLTDLTLPKTGSGFPILYIMFSVSEGKR